jgi:hypothetical protein
MASTAQNAAPAAEQEAAGLTDSAAGQLTTSSFRRTISDRSIQGRSVSLVRNQYPRTTPRVYRLVTLEKLLEDSMEICQLNQQARKAFKKDGSVVKSVDEVGEQETLYISMGEAFGYGVNSPARLKKPSAPPTPLLPRRTIKPPRRPLSLGGTGFGRRSCRSTGSWRRRRGRRRRRSRSRRRQCLRRLIGRSS